MNRRLSVPARLAAERPRVAEFEVQVALRKKVIAYRMFTSKREALEAAGLRE